MNSLQISLPILNKYKRINFSISPEIRTYLIGLNPLDIKNKIWRRSFSKTGSTFSSIQDAPIFKF